MTASAKYSSIIRRFAMIVEDNVVKELILEDPKVRVCPSLAALTAEKLEILNAERLGDV